MFIFSSHDVSKVQGVTEAYYVCKILGEEFETHLFAPLSSDIENVKTHPIRYGGTKGLILMNLVYLPYLMWMGFKHKPSIVYSYRNVILPPLLLKIFGKSKLVYDIRADPYQQPKEFRDTSPWNRFIIKLGKIAHSIVLSRSDAVITLSDPLKQQLKENFNLKEDKLHVVPLGVDTGKFDVSETETEYFRIVYVGSIARNRGLDTVLQGLSKLDPKLQKQIKLDLFGSADEEYIQELQEIADTGDFKFEWHGYVPHEDIPKLAGECDAAISPLPPLKSFDVSSPAKIYEYLALGLPVIATQITPHKRILTHEKDSLLVNPEDPESIRYAVQRLLKDPEFVTDLSKRARKKGEQNSWDSRIESILEIIDNLEET